MRHGISALLIAASVIPFAFPSRALAQQTAPNQVAAPAAPPQQGGTTTPAPQQPEPAPPVGTAAAPYEQGVGVAASRPAGAVIAPAKQRRIRSLVIRIGLIAGAAVAVGTVVGLSAASPSRPH